MYRIQRNPRAKPKVVHRDRLNRYHGKLHQNWLEPLQSVEGKRDHENLSVTQPLVNPVSDQSIQIPVSTPQNELLSASFESVSGFDVQVDSSDKPIDNSDRPKRNRKAPERYGEWLS